MTLNNRKEDWIDCELGEVCDIINGKNQRDVLTPDGKYPIYGSGGIFGRASSFLCEAGTTTIGRKGTINSPIFVNERFWNVDTAFGISPLFSTNKRYVHFFCLSFNFKKLDRSTTIPSLAKTDIAKISIPLAPLPIQRAIVSKIEALFSDLDNGIANFKKAQDQLKVYRQAVLKKAFEGELTKEWREGFVKTDDTTPVKTDGRPSQLPTNEDNLPTGWKWVKVCEIAETFGGFAFKSNDFSEIGDYQVIRMGNVRSGLLRLYESPVFLNDVDDKVLKKALLEINDIIITQTGTKSKRDYGFTTLINKPNLLLNQRIAAIRCNEKCNPKYLLYFTWTDVFKDQFFANETGNVGQGNVGMKAVTDTLVLIPIDFQEQTQIVQEIERRLSVCDKMEQSLTESIAKAEALRQSILKKAFEGKLLSQAEIEQCKKETDYEPAGELLKKIQAEKVKTNGRSSQRVKKDSRASQLVKTDGHPSQQK